MSEKHVVPGCGHFDSSRGICRLMFEGGELPSLAKKAMIDPPGAIEGPPGEVEGWLCTAARNTSEQEACSAHIPRFVGQDEEDHNW